MLIIAQPVYQKSLKISAENNAIAAKISNSGRYIEYSEIPGFGHHIPAKSTRVSSRVITQAVRKPFSAQILYATHSLEFCKSRWVELDLVDTPGVMSRISATLVDTSDVLAWTTNLRQIHLSPDQMFEPNRRSRIAVDGQEIWIDSVNPGKGVTLVKSTKGTWATTAPRWVPGKHLNNPSITIS